MHRNQEYSQIKFPVATFSRILIDYFLREHPLVSSFLPTQRLLSASVNTAETVEFRRAWEKKAVCRQGILNLLGMQINLLLFCKAQACSVNFEFFRGWESRDLAISRALIGSLGKKRRARSCYVGRSVIGISLACVPTYGGRMHARACARARTRAFRNKNDDGEADCALLRRIHRRYLRFIVMRVRSPFVAAFACQWMGVLFACHDDAPAATSSSQERSLSRIELRSRSSHLARINPSLELGSRFNLRDLPRKPARRSLSFRIDVTYR